MIRFKDMIDFSGKNIVVTGGLGLIGQHICSAFAQFNGNVIVADIEKDKFKKFINEKIFELKHHSFHYVDITNPAIVAKCVEKIVKGYHKIDVWVNLAYPRTKDWNYQIEDVTFDSWDNNLRMHLGGYFWSSKLILEQMKRQHFGCLINFGSIYGIVGPNFELYKNTKLTLPVAYSAIKGAIISLSRYFAALYGPYNVRVNTICPGGVFNNQDNIFVKKYSKLTPLRRMAKAKELAMPTLFLASEGASYITGHTLIVDGGWSCW